MELYRKIYSKIVSWKNTANGKTALLIEGARRVGKTTIVKKFANENYKSYIFIDFGKASKSIKDNFDNLNNLDIFFQNLSLEYNVRLHKRESLIVFDEIQSFPRAREAIKYLVEDGRYDFIETGSLISINENVLCITISSEEKKIKMYPLDFEEFLLAEGEDILVDYIKSCYKAKRPLDDNFHKKATRYLREYMLVGGMPRSVVAYIENNKDFYSADIEKRRIISLYRDDIKKAAKKYSSKVSSIFENIPGFLSQHEKRIIMSKLSESGSSSKYDDPIFWLGDSMICNVCYRCNDPNVGFSLNKDDTFVKCYLGDTGLLVSLAFSENEIISSNLYKCIMDGKLSLNEGMLHENLIAQMLTANGKQLFYYTHYSEEKRRNDMEIDFLISSDSKTNVKVYPIEVKSSNNFITTSYNAFKLKFGKRIAESYVISPKQFRKTDDGYYIPSYMAFCLFNE